jgi:hypothetical protein
LGQTSFGLSPNDKEAVILEPMFLLMYYGGFTYTEAYNLPIQYKRWFIQRISKEIQGPEDPNNPDGPHQGHSRAYHHNTPDVAAMQNKARQHVPAKLRRF